MISKTFPAVEMAGLRIISTNLDYACNQIINESQNESTSSGIAVHLVNSYTISLTYSDINYYEMMKQSKCNLPDGRPLSLLLRLKSSSARQVRGPSLMESVLDRGRKTDLRHFLLGSTPEILANLRANIEKKYPGVNICGQISPPFRALSKEEQEAQDKEIAEARADIVWVGLGTPKQDWEAERLAKEMVGTFIAVGAAFDFASGARREAPNWMSSLCLEWLFRLATEPKRLWRRYLIGNIQFLLAVVTR